MHPRIPSAKLGITQVNIRNRQRASLVDLSSGGALLELPFQLAPESRVAMQFDTADKRLEVSFQLLRCYVARLDGGIRYHAAGAFDRLLDLEALTLRASSVMQRLVVSLERLERTVHSGAASSRTDARFHETLTDLLSWLRQGESIDLMALKLKARLTQSYKSLLIIPAASPTFDSTTSMECFGLTFKARQPLSGQDRRYLKAHAQLISILEEARRELLDEDLRPGASQVRHAAESALSMPRPAVAAVMQARTPSTLGDEVDYFSALKLDPAFA